MEKKSRIGRWAESGEPFVRRLAKEASRTDSRGEREAMENDPRVASIKEELAAWPGTVLNSHKSAVQPFQRLAFLADIGVGAGDAGMKPIVGKVLASFEDDGLPRLPMNIPASFGGSGTDTSAWALCDAPVTLRALKKMGVKDSRVEAGIDAVAALVRENGAPCAVSAELGAWHGPGKRGDPCPFATLACLRLFLESDRDRGAGIALCAEALRKLWRESLTWKPYIFYMGNDFRKLKLPFVWYDILSVADALSRANGASDFPELREMAEIIAAKRKPDGTFVPESVYQACKGWDFGQKKAPSEWMGFVADGILERAGLAVE